MKTHALRLSRTKNLHFAIAPFPRFSAVESTSIVEETILVKSAKEQKSGMVGKLKNMFGKAKKKPVVVVPEVLEDEGVSVESHSVSPEAEQRSAFAASGWK